MVVKEGSSFVFVFLELLKQGDKNQTPRPSDWLLSHTTLDCELYVVLTMLASCYFFFFSLFLRWLCPPSVIWEKEYMFLFVCVHAFICVHTCMHTCVHILVETR